MKLNDIERQYIRRELQRFQMDDLSAEEVSHCTFHRRQFEIVQKSTGAFLPYECIPTGGVMETVGSGESWRVCLANQVDIIKAYFQSPGDFSVACAELGLERKNIIFTDPDFPFGSLQYETFSAALEAIYRALEEDAVLMSWRSRDNHDEASADIPFQSDLEILIADRKRWSSAIQTQPRPESLFYKTDLGVGLSDNARAKVLDYLNAPSFEKWEGVRGFPVFENRRVWDILFLHDQKTPAKATEFTESNIPTPGQLANALSQAVVLHNEDCGRRLQAIDERLAALQLANCN